MDPIPVSSHAIVTPEAVVLDVEPAGLGSRALAQLLDWLIQFAMLSAIFMAGAGLHLEDAWLAALAILATVMIFWGYYFIFEGLWNGQTPGKRAQRLRAVRVDGQPMRFTEVLVRNILRIVDFLPSYYLVGAVSIVVTSRSQRIGDLAAGTIVVRERRTQLPAALSVAPPPPPVPVPAGQPPEYPFDPNAITEAQYELTRSFLQRRQALEPQMRAALAHQVASRLRDGLATAGGIALVDEALIEAVAAAYQSRFRTSG